VLFEINNAEGEVGVEIARWLLIAKFPCKTNTFLDVERQCIEQLINARISMQCRIDLLQR
jgi:hypothetical protein